MRSDNHQPTNLDSIREFCSLSSGLPPLIHVGATVQKAVDASRPEAGTQIRDSRQAVKDVSESQGEYCDASAQADIVLGERRGMISMATTDEMTATDLGRGSPRIWVPRGQSSLPTLRTALISYRCERSPIIPTE
jgi:hypothetical protein